MDNYGMNMLGGFVVEKVQILPDWSVQDAGRMLFDLNEGNYYLGAPEITIGNNGWIPVGVVSSAVKSYNIDWDFGMTGGYGKVSAVHMPVLYDTTSTTLQGAITDINAQIAALQSGSTISPASIKDYHIDFTGTNALTSGVIPCDNTEGYFSGSSIKIEDALNQLQEKDASSILLDTSGGDFGGDLGFSSTTIQGALESIEDYLNDLTASDVPCTYEGCGCTTNVQFAIDALYNLHANLKLVDLIDVPAYDSTHKYLKSNGSSCVEWVTPWAIDFKCYYPGSTEETVQGALNSIKSDLDSLQSQINEIETPHHFSADDIAYDRSGYDDVDDALDYMFTNFYYNSAGHYQPAELTPCSSINGNDDVNTALLNINSRLTSVESSLPCTVGASDVTYNSGVGSTVKAALDYIMNYLSYVQTNCSGQCSHGFFST